MVKNSISGPLNEPVRARGRRVGPGADPDDGVEVGEVEE